MSELYDQLQELDAPVAKVSPGKPAPAAMLPSGLMGPDLLRSNQALMIAIVLVVAGAGWAYWWWLQGHNQEAASLVRVAPGLLSTAPSVKPLVVKTELAGPVGRPAERATERVATSAADEDVAVHRDAAIASEKALLSQAIIDAEVMLAQAKKQASPLIIPRVAKPPTKRVQAAESTSTQAIGSQAAGVGANEPGVTATTPKEVNKTVSVPQPIEPPAIVTSNSANARSSSDRADLNQARLSESSLVKVAPSSPSNSSSHQTRTDVAAATTQKYAQRPVVQRSSLANLSDRELALRLRQAWQLGESVQVQRLLQAFEQGAGASETLEVWLDQLLLQSNWPLAEQILTRYQARAGADIHWLQAKYYVAMRRFDMALEQLESLPQNTLKTQTLRAGILQKLQQYHAAQDIYLSIINQGQANAEHWLGYALSSDALSQSSRALAAYRRALHYPQSASVAAYVQQRIGVLGAVDDR